MLVTLAGYNGSSGSNSGGDGTFFEGTLATLFVDTDFVDGGTSGSCCFEGVVTYFSTFPSDLRGLWSR